jgi:hypothetical protein
VKKEAVLKGGDDDAIVEDIPGDTATEAPADEVDDQDSSDECDYEDDFD